MEQADLEELIEKLDAATYSNEGLLGIYNIINHEPDSFIKANKTGLLLLASQLLKAAAKAEEETDDDTRFIPLMDNQTWLDQNSDIIIRSVKPITATNLASEKTDKKETLMDKIIPVGCVILFLFVFISLITGIVTIGKLPFD